MLISINSVIKEYDFLDQVEDVLRFLSVLNDYQKCELIS